MINFCSQRDKERIAELEMVNNDLRLRLRQAEDRITLYEMEVKEYKLEEDKRKRGTDAVSKDIDTLSRTLYGESAANDVKDAEAIACVIMNRVAYKNWPNNVHDVCLQPWQFSCWNDGDPNKDRITKIKSSPWFNQCKEIARLAVEGRLIDPTKKSTHYYAEYIAVPKWAKGKKPVYRTKSHLFFNDIDTPAPSIKVVKSTKK